MASWLSRFSSSRLASGPSAGLRPPWRWAALGAALGLVLVLAWQAPARWLGWAVAQATQARVQLADAQGSVWNGNATLVLTGGPASRDSARLPGRVQWQLRPAWLGLRLHWLADCCTAAGPLEMHIDLGWRRARLLAGDGRSQWPASLLAGLGAPWNTLQAEGTLELVTQGLSVEWAEGRPRMSGRAELMAMNLSSRLSTVKPLGSYRVALTGGDVPALALETIEGSLLLSGSGQWVGPRLRFQGQASAAPEREAALANLLNIIGRRQGSRSIISLG